MQKHKKIVTCINKFEIINKVIRNKLKQISKTQKLYIKCELH